MAQAEIDEIVALDPQALDSAPEGREFEGLDYWMLALLGIAIPIVLLIWGWL